MHPACDQLSERGFCQTHRVGAGHHVVVIVNQWVLLAMDFTGMATQPCSFINTYACMLASLYVCLFV